MSGTCEMSAVAASWSQPVSSSLHAACCDEIGLVRVKEVLVLTLSPGLGSGRC
jgi:hypothetical protein